MKELMGPDGAFDQGLLWKMLQELEAGELGLEQRDELMSFIGSSPTAQRCYLEYFELAALLEEEATTYSEEGMLPVMNGVELGFRHFKRSLLAAAALVILGGLLASLVMVKQASRNYLTAEVLKGTQWSVTGPSTEPSNGDEAKAGKVAKGATVHVVSGLVKLAGKDGAAIVMQGPARVSFPEFDKPVLHEGWLWIDTEKSGEPLEVKTPELVVSDIGTRFGVRVPADGPAEVHLIEGKVEVFSRATEKMIATLEPEKSGFVLPAIGESTRVVLARDPFPELPDLLAASANYPTTVRGQNPVGYWRMEEGAPGSLVNTIPEGVTGSHGPQVITDEAGPQQTAGYGGFDEDNASVFLSGEKEKGHLSLGTAPIHDGVLFEHEFLDQGGGLLGVQPAVTFGDASWVAAPLFQEDGSIQPGKGTATLAFSPVDGVMYTLDATVTTTRGASEDWIGLGFGHGQTTKSARFNSGGIAGRVWMLHRAADTHKPVNRAWLSTDGADWDWSPTDSPLGGTMDLRIVLDTTAGAGAWTATWFAKRPSEGTYVEVRESKALINELITSIGFSVIGGNLSASIENFSLRAEATKSHNPGRHQADGPARVAWDEGAVSFWLRREPGVRKAEMLWAAGAHQADDSIYLQLTAEGTAGFFMENGRYDVQIASSELVSDGQWHHLAASWSPSKVALYLDGQLVAWDSEERGLLPGVLQEVRFGGRRREQEFESFSGRVDELAIWNRALTSHEVRHQFSSALGSQITADQLSREPRNVGD
jgi:hypothetical protein